MQAAPWTIIRVRRCRIACPLPWHPSRAAMWGKKILRRLARRLTAPCRRAA